MLSRAAKDARSSSSSGKRSVVKDSLDLATTWSSLWRRFFRHLRWITHPITVFVTLQIVWIAITLIWVLWFVRQQSEIANLAQRFGRENFNSGTALMILIVGCVLLGMLLVGTISLFIFGQRQTNMANQHRSFISSVTHELKSPLASLQLAVETMVRHKLDAAMTARINSMIMTDIERLKRLVDQILVAARIDRGAFIFPGEQERTNLTELIQSIAGKLSYLDGEFAARLELAIPEDLYVKVASSSVDLMLSNLLENAIKYAPAGSTIKIEVKREDTKDVVISVKDCGQGLNKKDLRKVFKMFYRSEVATRKAIPGTGLGLYIVKSVAKVLGGKVWVESEGLGRGATFFISLPAGYFTMDNDEDYED